MFQEPHTVIPKALTEEEVSRRLSISKAALRKWRASGKGPGFMRCGRMIRYIESELERWIEERIVEPVAQETEE